MSLKFYKFILIFFFFSSLFVSTSVFAVSGSISASNHTANLCEDTNCSVTATSSINFGYFTTQSAYNVVVDDDSLSGYIWGEQFGWVVLNCINTTSGCSATNGNFKVSNDGEGNLSGYAWGDVAGWINFGPFVNNAVDTVSINSENGEFFGFAWSQGFGWIKFDCNLSTSCVVTDWRPEEEEEVPTVSDSTPAEPPIIPPTPIEPPTPPVPVDPPAPPTPPTPPSVPSNPGGPSGPGGGGGNSGGGSISSTARIISEEITKSFEVAKEVTQKAAQKTKEILDTPTGDVVTKTVTTAGVVAGASVSVASALFLNPLSFSEIFLLPVRLWALLMAVFGLRKRNRPWGTVYDSVTKQPLDPAYVVLQDLNGNEISTSITDLDGRYGFLLSPGNYKIIANKTNYTFPSQRLNGKNGDDLYGNLYFGEEINVINDGEVIAKNIPLDPIKFDWNEFAKNKQHLMRFYRKRDIWLARITKAMFGFGFTVTAIALFVAPKTYNIVTFALYVILFILKRTALKPKPHGSVLDKDTGNPLSFAILRIYKEGIDKEFLHKITDKIGRFICLVPNGRYYVTIEKKIGEDSYQKIFTSEVFDVKKGYIKKNFEISSQVQPDVIQNQSQLTSQDSSIPQEVNHDTFNI